MRTQIEKLGLVFHRHADHKEVFVTAAEAALVTVPLGVLKKGSINFQPPLPSRKQEAIDRMGFGILNKAQNFGHLLCL